MASRYSSNGAHQRELRTLLFGNTPPNTKTPPSRTSSPYDPTPSQSAKNNESYLLSLESQNNDEMDSMGQKVAMLKNLGVKMGTEINKSIKLNDEITNGFEKGTVALKRTFNNMVVMSQRAGISLKMWFAVFAIVGLWFFWIWLT